MSADLLALILTALLGANGVLGLLVFVVRQRALSGLRAQDTRLKQAEGDLERTRAEATAKLEEVRIRALDTQATNDLLTRLVEVNQRQTEALRDANASNERNYHVIQASLSRTEQQMLVMLQDTLRAVKDLGAQMVTMQAQFEASIGEGLARMAEVIAHQRGAMHLGVVFVFPPDDDPRWQWAVMRPRYPGKMPAYIYHRPFWSDGGENVAGEIREAGDVVRWIKDGPVLGVFTVRKDFGADRVIRGYVNEYAVIVDELPTEDTP